MELTDIWPPFPIIITNLLDGPIPRHYDFNSAIVHHNRVCQINLFYLTSWELRRLASAMHVQFPALIHLKLESPYDCRPVSALPDGFLGGSAPNLQTLELHSIAFPALPNLLLSTTHLVHLTLRHIPISGYFSPEAIVTCLAVLANLKSLTIVFKSGIPFPDRERRRPLPPTHTVLPALTRFQFNGVSEYLEHLVASIDAPLLDSISITFFHELKFAIPKLAQFMRHTTRFQALNEAHVDFGCSSVRVGYLPPPRIFDEESGLKTLCRSDRQHLSLAQVFTSFFPSIGVVEHLYIYGSPPQWQDGVVMDIMQWLHLFTAVRNLHVCEEYVQHIADALKGLVRERVADVLPALECLFLEDLGSVEKAIGRFVAARLLLGHRVAVSPWKRVLLEPAPLLSRQW